MTSVWVTGKINRKGSTAEEIRPQLRWPQNRAMPAVRRSHPVPGGASDIRCRGQYLEVQQRADGEERYPGLRAPPEAGGGSEAAEDRKSAGKTMVLRQCQDDGDDGEESIAGRPSGRMRHSSGGRMELRQPATVKLAMPPP